MVTSSLNYMGTSNAKMWNLLHLFYWEFLFHLSFPSPRNWWILFSCSSHFKSLWCKTSIPVNPSKRWIQEKIACDQLFTVSLQCAVEIDTVVHLDSKKGVEKLEVCTPGRGSPYTQYTTGAPFQKVSLRRFFLTEGSTYSPLLCAYHHILWNWTSTHS